MSLVKYSLLSFPLASFGLGVWQIKRLNWKTNLLSELDQRLSEEPADLLEIKSIEDINNSEYQRFKLKGRFDQDLNHQLYLKPRQLVVNDEALSRGRTALQSNIGVNVVTPFQLHGTDLRVLVNRGWLATRGKDSVENSVHLGMGSKDEQLEFIGILRKTDQRPRYGLKNNESTNVWPVRDVEAMARAMKTAPIFFDAEQGLSSGKGPIGGQTQLQIRNEHLNYIITWFSLAALSYAMWYYKYGKHGSLLLKNRSVW